MVFKKLFKKSQSASQASEPASVVITKSQEVATQTLFSQARSAQAKGDYPQAITLYTQVIKDNPTGLPMTYFYRAECYRQTGDAEKADQDLQKYKEITAAPPTA